MKIPKKMIIKGTKYELIKIYSKFALYLSEYGWKECFSYNYFVVKEAERRKNGIK